MSTSPSSDRRGPAGAGPGAVGAASRAGWVLTRRRLEVALGGLWLLDGLLQFQPYMFTHAFFAELLSMANMGLPGWLSTVLYRITSMLTAQPVLWNTLFATLQVALGAGLIWGRSGRLTQVARLVSIGWALAVFVVGEGVGELFMPGTGALNGAPGAALLYAVLAVLLWPRGSGAGGGRGAAVERGAAAADEGVLGGRVALACWAVLWAGLAALELAPANHDPAVPAGETSNLAAGEPGWLAALNRHVGSLLEGRGVAFAVAAGLIMLIIAVAVTDPRSRRAALAAGAVLGALFGLIGQDFGGLLTGQATDPGTAPLLVLLALALWPRSVITAPQRPASGLAAAAAGTAPPGVAHSPLAQSPLAPSPMAHSAMAQPSSAQPSPAAPVAASPDSMPCAAGPSRPAAAPIDLRQV
jgi:hypothetical protein